MVTDVARLEHGQNLDRLIPDPFDDWAWIVTLKDGGTATIRVNCII